MVTANSNERPAQDIHANRVLFVTLGDPLNTADSDIVIRLRAAGISCDQLVLPYRKRWKRLIEALWAARHIKNYDVVITNEYNNAFIFNLVDRFLGNNTKHIIIGMNLSGRALKLGWPPVDQAIDKVFQNLSRIIVHSREEIDLFSNLHDIPKNKIVFSSWGFDAPTTPGPTTNFSSEMPRYFCMIGRNNRDFATFTAALANCDVDGIIVCGRDAKITASDTGRLRVFYDLSMEECAACVKYSLANVILVNDADRGAGHITAVMGMQFARPHIFTDVPTLRDYLVPDQHGIGVVLKDVTVVTQAMLALMNDEELAFRFGQAAQIDARAIHSHIAAQNRIFDIISRELGL